MLPVRKTVSKKTAWGTQEQNFWIKITASRLSYELELGLHGGKKFNGNFGIWKMDSEDDIFHTLSKTENFMRVILLCETD